MKISNKESLEPLDINIIADKLNIVDNISVYGKYMAKINFDEIKESKKGKLILVTATSPTPFGEGKTTVSIGLLDAFYKLDKKAICSLREPSQGPVFGLKGGATGGGLSQVIPKDNINLHFTGDFHAITSANNLLCAAIDNHIYYGNELNIDENKIVFNRCIDVNDRALRNIILVNKNYKRKEFFDITAASEIMAILCLSKSLNDLKNKLDNILLAYSKEGKPIFAKQLNITGALLVLLKDAIKPNLVQTLEHNPVIIHGGPFANIAHGCSSVLATNTCLKLCDYCITEAGFGSDLGALKFYDIKCRKNRIMPDVTVLVTSIKALKYNGDNNLEKGFSNLLAHLNILKHMTKNIIVCLNKFKTDTQKEIELLKDFVKENNVLFSISTAYTDGGSGAIDLANKIIDINNKEKYIPLYDINDKLNDKINFLLKKIYQVGRINYSKSAKEKMCTLERNNLDKLPICIAKTPYSISDNKKVLGNPKNYSVTIKDIKLYNGAGFITVYLGNIITMPGLPKTPNYEKMNIVNNKIIGLK